MSTPGALLGPYQLSEPIGAGGMGEVWKARDPRVDRTVAIKTSKAQFTERFSREARAVAALNHPNICTLYDVGPDYLVMEYVEGDTLAEAIARGELEQTEILAIAGQIADALEEAHSKGVTHRDLKPANVKIRHDGMVKVLDFGLAKIGAAPDQTSPGSDNSPTITMGLTEAGVILGTASYMSPEQARGKNVDKRADIWAFGVVLYEMLMRRRPFQGADMGETLASVIKSEPDYTGIPPRFERLLRKCLEKDPRKRLRDIGDWRLLLVDDPPPAVAAAPAAPARKTIWPWVAAGFFAAALAALAYVHFRETPPAQTVIHAVMSAEDVDRFVALSPDGRRLATVRRTTAGEGESTQTTLWVRNLDSEEWRRLPGAEGLRGIFWSPDSRTIGFFADGKLKTVPAAGGPPQTLCDANNFSEGAWNLDGVILFNSSENGFSRTQAGGGECRLLAKTADENRMAFPDFLPDGRHFLYLYRGADAAKNGIYVAALDTPWPSTPSGKRLLPDASPARFVPHSPGGRSDHILFVRDGSLMSQAFDAGSLELSGDAVAIASQVAINPNSALNAFATSGGLLLYIAAPGLKDRQLTWFDRSGKQVGKLGPVGEFGGVVLSPDEKTVAVERRSSPLTLVDIAHNSLSALTAPGQSAFYPVWSPDSSSVVYVAGNGVYLKNVKSGEKERLLFSRENGPSPTAWSLDGRYLLFTEDSLKTQSDVWYVADPLGPGPLKPQVLVQTETREGRASVSPDGRWIAYESIEPGGRQIFVRPFPSGPGKWRITSKTGTEPRWSRDGKELFYLSQGRRQSTLEAVAVRASTGPNFEFGEPNVLFEYPSFPTPVEQFVYAPSGDGQRFLFVYPVSDTQPTLHLITNWEQAPRGK